MVAKFLLISLAAIGLSACSSLNFERSNQSGYADSNGSGSTVQDYFDEKRSSQAIETMQELGIDPRQSHSNDQIEAVRARLMVKRLEGGLTNDSERRQYFDLKPYFASDRQRIEFLRQPSRDARERFVQRARVGPNGKVDGSTQKLIDTSDIARGMTREAVKLSWGEPDAVEVAGNTLRGNERWVYRKLMSSEDGYRQEIRMIYFESGRVAGWETE